MACFLVKAPKDMGYNIPKGFTMQVVSRSTGGPDRSEIEEALKRAGFTSIGDYSWASPGNWEIKKM